jgi:hypothetical protein
MLTLAAIAADDIKCSAGVSSRFAPGYYAKWSISEAESTMRQPIDVLADYLNLARAARQRRQPLVRDRALLLAGVIAAQIELEPVAAACREEILAHNGRHMVGRWPTMWEALEEEDFQTLVSQLSTRYGPERVERMVEQLEIDDRFERAGFASDGEFAAALLGTSWQELVRRFGDKSED